MKSTDNQLILIMAGGTGGHVFPALATAFELKARGHQVCWLGTRSGLEAEVVPANEIPIEFINVVGVRGKNLATLIKAPFLILAGIFSAMKIIHRQRPASILGMGGFVTVPGGIAAFLLGKPLVIHEQNAVAGSANRLLSRFAKKIFCGFPNVLKKGEFIGNPLRREICELACVENKPVHKKKHLLVLGGSLGALALNRLLPEALSIIEEKDRPIVKHQCGRQHVEVTRALYEKYSVTADVEPFIKDMAGAYSWADLVICRAGALTVAEASCAGLPAIFVPYPYAIDDHQTGNALVSEKAGAAVVLQQSELNGKTLHRQLMDLLNDEQRLQVMSDNARKLARPHAAADLADGCLEVACA
ncbi:MAG: undecaprenyldiphospho-muramoylpentapeptide beta-N-acetylglucosaminyltransferase [Pseudomonadales bacterium]|nr:undecaprenyldiphospho-muramoylpentapeptide beta-N-acetylglucosaminyltransferase [Pseudomonadales bacterium]